MPRFYFNVRFGPGPEHLAVDPEGDELPDLTAAHDHALTIARDLIARTQLSAIRDWFACSFEIENAQAHPLLTIPFTDAIPERNALSRTVPDEELRGT